jgi:hypothetical protein
MGIIMNQLYLESTKYTPAINFDPGAGKFEISGVSLPENVVAFFEPVLEWLDKYSEILSSGMGHENSDIRFAFKLSYYNSGSVRYIISMLETLKKINNFRPVKIEWFYDKDDVLLLENGKELEVLSGLKFYFIELD